MGRESNHLNAKADFRDWTVQTFDFLEPTGVWAPTVSRELAERWNNRTGTPRVTGWGKSRQFQTGIDPKTSQGLVLFFAGIEKECLSILSRLMDDPQECPVVAVLSSHHRDLVPVLLESNVTSVIMEPVNDVPIADWCLAMFDLAISNKTDSAKHAQNAKTRRRFS